MKLFSVTYLDTRGRKRSRRGWAMQAQALRQEVLLEGGRIVEVEAGESSPLKGAGREKLPAAVAIAWADHMAMQLEAGIPLETAVASLARESDHPGAQRMMAGVHQVLCVSGEVASAFGRFPRQFPPHVVEMLAVGHRTGRLGETFRSLGRYWAEAEDARGLVRKALVYPISAAIIMTTIAIFLLGFVLPSFARVFKELGVELPALTRLYLALSDGLVTQPLLWFGVAASFLGGCVILGRSEWGQHLLQRGLARLPLTAEFTRAVAVARLASNLSTLLGAGIPTQDALRSCRRCTGNIRYDEALEQASLHLGRGDPLSIALRKTGVFPGLLATCLRVGETANRLHESLGRAHDYYHRNARQLLQTRLQVLEPLLTVTLGLFVGSIALSLFYPMITLAMNIRR